MSDMSLFPLPGPLEIIRRHPPLAAELARRLTSAPLPAPGETVVELLTTHMSVELDGRSAPAIKVTVYRTPHPDTTTRAGTLTVMVAAQDGACQIMYRSDMDAEVSAPVAIDSDSGSKLADAGPWMTVFAATIGAVDLLKEEVRRTVLDAVDATGSGTAGIRALSTLIIRAASQRARWKLESDMGTGPSRGTIFESFMDDAYSEGYADGLLHGREETAIVMLLTARGVPLTDAQRRRISSCDDVDRLSLWFSRAVTAATAEEVFGRA
jgi:hypothetical protein